MLDLMRRSANSWLIVLLFAAIIFVFAINFGPWAGQVGTGMPYAADINGRVITIAEFQSAYAMQFRAIQNYRSGYTADQAEAEGLRQIVLDQLVSKELLAQLGERHGLMISDAELAQFIKERFFGPDKPFDREAYRRAVYSNFQSTESQFETQIRRELLADRMAELLGTAAYVSDDEIKSTFENRYRRVSLDLVRVDPKSFAAPVMNDKAVDEWATKHEEEITKYYNQHVSEFRSPKQVRARHILIKASQQASEQDKSKARQKIEQIKKRVAAGEDFAKVAKESSEDSTAKVGGDLGFFGEGAMVKPFEEAAFKLDEGQISDVVESPFGYHVIKVEEVKLPVHREVKDVRAIIAKRILAGDEQKKVALKNAEEILAKVKAGAKVKMANTGFFRRDARFVPEIGKSPEIVNAAFELTQKQPVAGKVFEVAGVYYVIKLKDREDPDMAKFEQEKDLLRATLLMSRKRQVMQDYVVYLKNDASITYNEQIAGTKKS